MASCSFPNSRNSCTKRKTSMRKRLCGSRRICVANTWTTARIHSGRSPCRISTVPAVPRIPTHTAELALEQWRDYFYEKYDYIVDNPSVGKEMREVWKLGSQPFSTPHCSPVQQTCLFPKRPYTQKVILGDCRKQPQDRNPHRGFCWFGGSPS